MIRVIERKMFTELITKGRNRLKIPYFSASECPLEVRAKIGHFAQALPMVEQQNLKVGQLP